LADHRTPNPLIAGVGGFEIRKDEKKVHPLDFSERYGLWLESDGSEQFYYGVDLVEFFMDLLNPKSTGIIAEVYSKIDWVNAIFAKHPETGVVGLLIETEMEKFECIQCGHCCLDLSDAYQASVPDSDVLRWEHENR
jgi:hypothetical protein